MRIVGLCAALAVGCHSETAYLGQGQPDDAGGTGGASSAGGAGIVQGGTSGRASGGRSAGGGTGAGVGGSGAEAGPSGDAGDSNGGVGANGADGGGGSDGGSGARGGTAGAGRGGSTGSSGSVGSGGSVGVNCPGGTLHTDIEITTQSELEEIRGYDTIAADLKIAGDVSDLTPLACLKQVKGDLVIGCANPEDGPCPTTMPLTTLTGLGALTTIGRWLKVSSTAVVDFDGLTSLTEVGGIGLFYNDELSSIAGLHGLGELSDGAILMDNGRLTSVEGLENITEIGGSLFLYGPFVSLKGLRGLVTATGVDIGGTNLVDLHGLEGLETTRELGIGYCADVNGELTCFGNPNLADIHALSHLTSVGSVSIAGNPLLRDLDDLSGAAAPPNFIASATIVNNASLTQVDGLSGLSGGGGTWDVWVEANPVLENLDGLAHLPGLINPQADIKIIGNDVLREVDLLHGSSPAELGSLVVRDNPSLVRFNALDVVSTVGNTLGGELIFSNNPALTEISGFHVTTSNPVTLAHLPSLTSSDAFSELATTVSLTVWDTGLTNLEAFGALSDVAALSITENPALVTLDGLEHVSTINEAFIDSNPLLTSLRGLRNVTTIGEGDGLFIRNNASLPECEAQWLCSLAPSASCTTSNNTGSGTCP